MNLKRFQSNLAGGFLVFLATFIVFRLSSVHTVSDSKYSMLFSQQLLWHGSFSFERDNFPQLKPGNPGEARAGGDTLPYQLQQVGTRIYYLYPPGAPVLSIPYVALMNAVGVSAIDQNGTYDDQGETRLQAGLAALLMSGLAVVIFHTSRLLLPYGWSWLITAAAAFGTQMWSTTSRAVWADTWGIFVLGFVVWLLLRAEVKPVRHRPLLLATLLSWLYFVRPTYCVPIVAVTLYLFFYHRSILLPYLVAGGAWLAAFVGYSQFHFGQTLPLYYKTDLSFGQFWEALAGNLVSPSRGLLIYVPVLAFVAYLLLRYRGRWVMRRFVWLSLAVITVHLVVISGIAPWHGGHCYGPRLSTGVVPWFVFLGILAVKTRLQWRHTNPLSDSQLRWRTEWILGALLLLCSITLHGIGGMSPRHWRWNVLPTNVDVTPERIWDWNHPQFFGVSRKDG